MAHAQAPPKADTKAKAPPAAQAKPPPTPQLPDAEGIVIMVRTALLTLNDALQTGNYTVLRDIAAPGFRDANTAAKLAQIFAALASGGNNLSVVAILPPQLAEAPAVNPKTGLLGIRGHFDAGNVRLKFALAYQNVGGAWRLFGISAQPEAITFSTPSADASKAPPAEKKSPPPAAKPAPAAKKDATPP